MKKALLFLLSCILVILDFIGIVLFWVGKCIVAFGCLLQREPNPAKAQFRHFPEIWFDI